MAFFILEARSFCVLTRPKRPPERSAMRQLVCRIAALGDTIITTPLIRYLKQRGDEVYYLASEQAEQILLNNPNVDKVIPYKRNSIPNNLLADHFKAVAQAYECDNVIDLCESIEVNISLHPCRPAYKYPKQERLAKFNRNFYEETFRFAKIDPVGEMNFRPDFFPTDQEELMVKQFLLEHIGKFVIIWGLSGSSRNKVYPYVDDVIMDILKKHDDIIVITVGDESCMILEYNIKDYPRVFPMSGVWNMRQSITACREASLVVSPDTGLLHGAGCWDTPKIGLLNATTKEQITKHFENDFSLEAEGIGCSPCLHLIYDADAQCSIRENKMPICMAEGISKERLINQIEEVYARSRSLSTV